MKTTYLAIAAVSLLQIASAQPYRRRHLHDRQHQNEKKGDVVVTVVDTVYAEATEISEVIVYVDEKGVPVSTVTRYIHLSQSVWSTASGSVQTTDVSLTSASTSTTSKSASTSNTAAASPENPHVQNVQASSQSTSSTPVAAAVPISTTTVKIAEVSPASQVTAAAPVTLTRSASPAATTSTSSSSKNVGSGFGLSYSPYKTNGECKTQEEVIKDFESISGYSLIRIYGTDCNQVAKMLTVCKSKGLKLFAGVFNIANVAVEIATIVTAAGGDWSHFDTISIGNEVVNSGTASASAVVAAIGAARALLKVAGYPGRVVTVDTLIAARANPSLCDASDYCAVNCHPFFDGTYAAAESGKFLSDMIPTLSAKLANKNQEIVIAETGWPWKGDTNQKAVPSLENQAAALASIRSTFASSPGSVILFSAYNDLWKTSNAFQFGAEQYWGMGGITSPTS